MKKQPYQQLEKQYAAYVKSKYAVSCNSGTSALHLALLAIGIKAGDEVIIPDFTMAACGFSVTYCGANPIFVDCDDTLCIDWRLIEAKITSKTKAIMPVHIYGRLCNMKEIMRIAKKHNLYVIEDACEAQGAVFRSKADITCYSFYENKIIHAEEGGICTTNNLIFKERMGYFKNMAFSPDHDYYHRAIGYNYRMPNTQASLALRSLDNVDKNLLLRRVREEAFNTLLIQERWGEAMPKRDVVWVWDYLGKPIEGMEIREFFKPLSSFPMYGGVCQSPKAEYYSKLGHYIKL